MVVKRYSNRRLYDTDESRYVTLDELAVRIRGGEDVRFIDAPTGDDITQTVLSQIILESRGASKLLPVPLLYQLIRLGDDALGEFFGKWMGWALQMYARGKQNMQAMTPYNPFASLPLAAGEWWARMMGAAMPWEQSGARWSATTYPPDLGPPPPEGYTEPPADDDDDTPEPETDDERLAREMAEMRAELAALKTQMKGKKKSS